MNLAQAIVLTVTTLAVIALLVNEIWGWEIRDYIENRRNSKQDRKLKKRHQRELNAELRDITQEMAEELDRQARYKERQERRAA